MQCDLWFPAANVPVGAGQVGSSPVLVMTAGYSRMVFAVMIPSRQAPHLICGHWELLQQIDTVPKDLVWDNEPAVGSWRKGQPVLAQEFEAFRGTLGIGVRQRRPRDPEAKGLVERTNGYLKTSFVPGRTSPPRQTSTTSSRSSPVPSASRHCWLLLRVPECSVCFALGD